VDMARGIERCRIEVGRGCVTAAERTSPARQRAAL
jgi:hypothetical protein